MGRVWVVDVESFGFCCDCGLFLKSSNKGDPPVCKTPTIKSVKALKYMCMQYVLLGISLPLAQDLKSLL